MTFHTEVRFIEVDAFVTDAAGTPVPNLKMSDFELYEDGTRQQIQSFAWVDIPIERASRPLYSPRAIESDVRSNTGGEGRLYLILLDDVHVHPAHAPLARASLRQFVERNFGTNDLAAVVRVRNTRDSQDFTNNPRLLLQAIDRFTGSIPRAPEVPDTPPAAAEPAGTDPPAAAAAPATAPVPAGTELPFASASRREIEIAADARDASSRVRELAEFLAGVRGRRKALIFVSEGSPIDTYAAMGQAANVASIVVEDTRKAIAAATRGNVTIYTIDPRGLMETDPNYLSGTEVPSTTGRRLSQDSLREIAFETGGFASVNMNDLDRTFERIVRENSAYYLLGYSPSNDRADGRYRRLEVRVRKPGLQVRSRNGYTASRDRSAASQMDPKASRGLAAVSSAIASPLPTSGLPLQVFAAPYRGPSSNASVVLAIEIDASKLDFVERNGLFVEQVEIAHGASNALGKAFQPQRHSVALNLKPATYDRAQKGGIRLLTHMELAPGRYQVRVAVGSQEGKAGSVFYDLEVPDFTRQPFAMSGLSLSSSRSQEALTILPKALPIVLKSPIVTSRVFDSRETVSVFGEVYASGTAPRAHTVDITTELRTDSGAVVRSSTERRSSSELAGAAGGYGFTAVVPLAGLTPGIYVVHSEARLNTGSRPNASRDVQISVR